MKTINSLRAILKLKPLNNLRANKYLKTKKRMRANRKMKTNNNMRFIKINNLYIDTDLLKKIDKMGIKKLVTILIHERIHAKIFKFFKIKKVKIYIFYKETEDMCYWYGKCRPLEDTGLISTLFMILFHYIYDIIYDIFYLDFWKLKTDLKDLLSDLSS